jgi:UDP-N-acetylglucosamine enolpyruvyl transferase
MQAQFMALTPRRRRDRGRDDLENRFMHVPELMRPVPDRRRRPGGDDPGCRQASGATVMATDPRSAGLVIAGLVAEGERWLTAPSPDRGYDRIASCGRWAPTSSG